MQGRARMRVCATVVSQVHVVLQARHLRVWASLHASM